MLGGFAWFRLWWSTWDWSLYSRQLEELLLFVFRVDWTLLSSWQPANAQVNSKVHVDHQVICSWRLSHHLNEGLIKHPEVKWWIVVSKLLSTADCYKVVLGITWFCPLLRWLVTWPSFDPRYTPSSSVLWSMVEGPNFKSPPMNPFRVSVSVNPAAPQMIGEWQPINIPEEAVSEPWKAMSYPTGTTMIRETWSLCLASSETTAYW